MFLQGSEFRVQGGYEGFRIRRLQGFWGLGGPGGTRTSWFHGWSLRGLGLAGPRALGLYFKSVEALPSVIWASLCSGSTVPDGCLPC